jgi:hypothetical protein
MPPPIAPADIICMSMTAGNTRETPARASVPSRPTKYVSISPTEACAIITRTLGAASLRSVAVMGASMSRRVRGLRAAS